MMIKTFLTISIVLLTATSSCGRKTEIDTAPKKQSDANLEQKDQNSEEDSTLPQSASPSDTGNTRGPSFQNIISPTAIQRPLNLATVTPNALSGELSGYSEFYNNKSEITFSCIGNVLDQTTKVRGGVNRLVMEGQYSGSDCNNELSAAPNTPVQVRILSVIECDGVDFTQYDGQPYIQVKDISDTQLCAGKEIGFTQQSTYTFQLAQQSNNQAQGLSGQLTYNSAIWSQGQLCKWVPNGQGYQLAQGCELISNTTYSNLTVGGSPNPNLKLDKYLRVVPQGLLKADSQSTFFASGRMQFELNGWQGQMTYTNPLSPPQWQAQSQQGSLQGILGQ